MNNTIKTILFLATGLILALASCRNASDNINPQIFDFRVDGVADIFAGTHTSGSLVDFEMNVSDDKGLKELLIVVSGEGLLHTEPLEGGSANVGYQFLVDDALYTVGDSLQIEFQAVDDFGNIGITLYEMVVD